MGMTANLKQISTETLDKILDGTESLIDFIYDEDDSENSSLDIDKAWHAIHFILNQSAWEGDLPLFNVILGGTEMGEDLGFGPVRYLTKEEVSSVASCLSNLSENELKNRFDPDLMNELDIYPSIDWREQGDQEYIFTYYEEVKNYYIQASKNNEAMLLYIT